MVPHVGPTRPHGPGSVPGRRPYPLGMQAVTKLNPPLGHVRFDDPPVDPIAAAALVRSIREELPHVRLLTDVTDRESYRQDETPYLHPGLPIAVALPANTAEVSDVVKLAARHRVPIVPRGAGTGLSGGACGIEGGLTVGLMRLDRILEIDHENLNVTVQPGVINADLKKAVAAEGLFYGPDPASYEMCSIGGNLGTNAGGLCCVKYGQTRDWVLGLEVVLADGTVIRTGGKNVKDVAGYSPDAAVRRVPGHARTDHGGDAAPAARTGTPARRCSPFSRRSSRPGRAVAGMTAAGMQPVTLELLDQFTIRAVEDWHHLGLDLEAEAMLLIESDLPPPASDTELDRAVFACEQAGTTLLVRAADAAESDLLRQARRLAYQALERLGTVKMEDIGVPRSRVPGDAGRHRGDLPAAQGPRRDVRSRRRRQPAPEPGVRARRPARGGGHRGGPNRVLPQGAGLRAARSRPSTASGSPARLPGAAARPRVRGRHARDQGRRWIR